MKAGSLLACKPLWLKFSRWSLPALRRTVATAAPGVVLRPYQEACIQSCLEALSSGSTRIGVSSPTGSGKTTIFVSLLDRLLPPPGRPNATRSLIIVSSIELARQAARNAQDLFPHLSVEIDQGQKNKASGAADITVATYQSLKYPERRRKFNPELLKAIIIDEAHHAAAPAYIKILSDFDPAVGYRSENDTKPPTSSGVPIIGFSATFSRHDGKALGTVFQRIVYHRDFLEMIKEQWLCRVRFTSVQARLDLTGVTISSRSGDFNATSLAQVVNTQTINTLVLQTWLDRAKSRRSTLIFCVNIKHVRDLTNVFREAGVDARFLHATTPIVQRRDLLQDFRDGKFPVLVNCAILTEGADIPNIDCVVVARPTRSRNLFAQIIGRGMRLSPETGKHDCHIIDFVDNKTRVGGVMSTPTLFGLESDIEIIDESLESLQAKAAVDANTGKRSTPLDIPKPESVTYTDYDDPSSLVGGGSGAPYLIRLSKFGWVKCGEDVYVLECMGKGFIKIQRAEEGNVTADGKFHFEATYTPASLRLADAMSIGVSPYLRKRKVLTHETLEGALKGCDTYVTNEIVLGKLRGGLLWTAKWRRAPATDGQKAFLAKRLKIPLEVHHMQPAVQEQHLNLATITKGEAANLITRLKHGARGHHQRQARIVAKSSLAARKLEEKVERETVRVGPLRAATG